MPTENFYSCGIQDSGKMDPSSFRTQRREHKGKSYNVLLGKLKGERSLQELTYNYPKDEWDIDEVQSHCESHGGHLKKLQKTQQLTLHLNHLIDAKASDTTRGAVIQLVANEANILASDVQKILDGEYPTKIEYLNAFAKVLNTSVDELKMIKLEDLQKRDRKCKYCGKRANKRVISKDGHVIPVDRECLSKAIHDIEEDGENDCMVVDMPRDETYLYKFTQKIRKVDSEKHQVAGPFIIPDEPDLQGQSISADEIREMIHDFTKSAFRTNIMHDDSLETLARGVSIVEIGALYNDVDYYGDGTVLKRGTGVITIEIENNPELWEKIKSGEYSAFSIEGLATIEEVPDATP